MEELTLTTPGILFSAISLIMLAFTNRFLAYAQLIRNLREEYKHSHSPITVAQIDNLRKRLYLTRTMQVLGIASLLLCVISMFFIFVGWQLSAVYCFGVALLSLILSLILSIQEIIISVKALEFHLKEMDK